jgi:hypothetical protein
MSDEGGLFLVESGANGPARPRAVTSTARPWSSAVKLLPTSSWEVAARVRGRYGLGRAVAWHPGFRAWRLRRAERQNRSPGWLCSIRAVKPCGW